MAGEVKVTLKVVDNLTKEGATILTKFGQEVKAAGSKTKEFMANFDARAFGAVFKGMNKTINLFQNFGAMLNKLAPDAKQFNAQFSEATQQNIQKTAESYNKLGASVEQFLGKLATKVKLDRLMDDMSARMSDGGAVLSERTQLEINKRNAEQAFRMGPSGANEQGSALRAEFDRLKKAVDDASDAITRFDDAKRKALETQIAVGMQKEKDDERRIRQRNEGLGIQLLGEAPVDRPQNFNDDPLNRAAREVAAIRRATIAAVNAEDTFDPELMSKAMGFGTSEDWRTAAPWEEWIDAAKQDEISAFLDMDEMERAFNEKKNDDFLAATKERLAAEIRAVEEAVAEQEAIDQQRMDEWSKMMEARQNEIDRWAEMLTSNFSRFFDDVISGTESLGRAFTRMIGGMIADAGRMMATDAMRGLFKSIVGSFITAPDAPQPWDVRRDGHAGGGFVRAGQPYLVGERGPEMFVPQSSGNIRTNAQSGGGGIGNVNITVNGAQDPSRTAQEVKRALLGLMANDAGVRQRMRTVTA